MAEVQTVILAAGLTSATSSNFAVTGAAATTGVRVSLQMPSAAAIPGDPAGPGADCIIQLVTPGGNMEVGRLNNKNPSQALWEPGTYNVHRPALNSTYWGATGPAVLTDA